MRWIYASLLTGSILLCMQACKTASATPDVGTEATVLVDERWELRWSDEFDTDGHPNGESWTYDLGDGCPRVCGWGNNELQYYTENDLDNARVEDGHLIIEAHKKDMGQKAYTSARLLTRNRLSWSHGKIDVRAKLPTGLGTWPAIWMLPEDNAYGGWPKSGEIDIMEHVGYESDSIYGTVHTEAFNHMIGTQVDKASYRPKAELEFSTYSLEWDEGRISWYIDGEQYHEFRNEGLSYKEWPFDQPFHLILNMAVGGNWGGKHGVDENIWPQRMVVDYVRVYQKDK